MIRAGTFLLAVMLLLAIPAPSDAQIYRWVDERGVPHFTEGIDSVPQQYRATAVPLPLRSVPPPAPAPPAAPAAPGAAAPGAPAARAAPSGTGGTTIRFTPGQRIMVSARINGATSVDLLLDTGADRTVMSPRVFAAAGISLSRGVGTGTIRGATGTANVTAVPIESIEVGEAKVGKMVVISHDIEQAGIDGLLGRDFLDQFNVNVDNAQGVVTLTPKK